MLWLALAGMALLAVGAAVAPLLARRGVVEAPRAAFDVALFRDQIAELDRERAGGEIDETEAAAARREIERRLLVAGRSLATASAPKVSHPGARARLAAVLACVIIPGALLIYLSIGSPQAPNWLSAYARFQADEAAKRAELAHLVELVEQRLAEDAEDGQGWALLASAKLRLGRMDDARTALANAKKFLPAKDAAEATARFAQTLADVSEGQALSPVRQYAAEAVELDPDNGRARMLLAFVAMRGGDSEVARAELETIVTRLPPDAPFAAQAKAMLARLNGEPGAGGPGAETPNGAAPKQAP